MIQGNALLPAPWPENNIAEMKLPSLWGPVSSWELDLVKTCWSRVLTRFSS